MKFKNIEPEIILFSGGLDSTLLTQYLLDKGKKLYAIYVDCGWRADHQLRLPLQRKAVNKQALYFKNKYPNQFIFFNNGIRLDHDLTIYNNLDFERWGSDDQWGIFIAGIYSIPLNVKIIWKADFTYTSIEGIEERGYVNASNHDGSLYDFLSFGCKRRHNLPKILSPASFYRHKEIDRFNSRDEAYKELDDYLKKYVRSCESDKWFCGECRKCRIWKRANLTSTLPLDL